MKNNDRFFLIIFFLLFSFLSFSQNGNPDHFFHKKRFNAGLIAGLNSSSLGGEGLDDFIGWNAGVIGIANVTKHLHFSLELLWSQNGGYLKADFFPDLNYSKVKMNFIEVPVQFNYQLQQNEELSDRKGWLRAGFSFAHLLNKKIEAENIDVSNQIIWKKEYSFLINFGGTFFLNNNWGIDIRMGFPTHSKDLIPTFALRGIYLL
ncbi:MAG: outer membrane beta-barrel protein [Saprospiraceae bacterium]